MGESGDSGQSSWVLESLVERLGFEAWRRGDWEEMQLGTCHIKTREKEKHDFDWRDSEDNRFPTACVAVGLPGE